MKIKNWKKHQHFKDRKPPWIKLYRDLLDDIEWHELDPKAAKALVMLWLIASEADGDLPDMKRLAFRLRLSETETKSICSKLSHWLEQDDINAISERYQSDSVETETEGETKKETEEKVTRKRVPRPQDVTEQTWDDWTALRKAKRAPVTQTVVDGAIREAGKAGMPLEAFLQVWCRRGSQGLEAAWLKPDERQQTSETTYQRSMRLRMKEAVPEIAKREPTPNEFFDAIDVQTLEVKHEPTYRLG